MVNEFDGSRYDSSGGYEIVPHAQTEEAKEDWQGLHDQLVQKAKDDLEKYLSGGEKLTEKFNKAVLKDLQEDVDPQFHAWRLIGSNKSTFIATTHTFWCSLCGSVKIMSASNSTYFHVKGATSTDTCCCEGEDESND